MQISLTLCCMPDLSAGKLWRISTCFLSVMPSGLSLSKQVSTVTHKRAARALFQYPSCSHSRAGRSYGSSRMQVACTELQTKTAPMNMQRGIHPTHQNWVPVAMCMLTRGTGLIWSRSAKRQCKMLAGNSYLVSRLSLSLRIKSIAKSSTLITLGVFALLHRYLRCSLFSRMNYVRT